jgi:hypothetical protein
METRGDSEMNGEREALRSEIAATMDVVKGETREAESRRFEMAFRRTLCAGHYPRQRVRLVC